MNPDKNQGVGKGALKGNSTTSPQESRHAIFEKFVRGTFRDNYSRETPQNQRILRDKIVRTAKALQPTPIQVSQRLPTSTKDVLAYHKDFGWHRRSYLRGQSKINMPQNNEATHWVELPEVP